MTIISHWLFFASGMLFLAAWQYFVQGRMLSIICFIVAVFNALADMAVHVWVSVSSLFTHTKIKSS